MPSRSGNPAAAALRAAGIACRVLAWALSALVVVNTFVQGPARAALLPVNTFLTRAVPGAFSGVLVFATPFGGAFHGDYCIAVVLLFVLDWALCKAASALR